MCSPPLRLSFLLFLADRGAPAARAALAPAGSGSLTGDSFSVFVFFGIFRILSHLCLIFVCVLWVETFVWICGNVFFLFVFVVAHVCYVGEFCLFCFGSVARSAWIAIMKHH